MIRRAPLRLRLEEPVAEHLREDIVVIRPDSAVLLCHLLRLRKQACKIQPHVVAFDLPEPFEELRRPRQPADRIVRLIPAKSQDGLAELIPDILPILLVRELQVLLRRGRVEIVLERLRPVLHVLRIRIAARRRCAEAMLQHRHPPLARRRCPLQLSISKRDRLCPSAIETRSRHRDGLLRHSALQHLPTTDRDRLRGYERLHPQLWLLRSELPTRKSAGISGIIDDPHPHIALLRLFGEFAEEGKVLRRKIRKRGPTAILHGDSAIPHLLHPIEIAADDLVVHRSAHSVVRLRPVLRRRIHPPARHLIRGRHLDLLPCALLRDCRLSDANRRQNHCCSCDHTCLCSQHSTAASSGRPAPSANQHAK